MRGARAVVDRRLHGPAEALRGPLEAVEYGLVQAFARGGDDGFPVDGGAFVAEDADVEAGHGDPPSRPTPCRARCRWGRG
ncbi:hypothetical protein AFM16_22290 [Streptomyces antibioticus]|uniref:Uncharacterized protein n=1 Tax=Streptomyces antibioticus TaxID=1890 RepID=A0ABX3LE86_STRAT|nr:hypothetical protein AFM16_22290 [Streptomyces antibioticus]